MSRLALLPSMLALACLAGCVYEEPPTHYSSYTYVSPGYAPPPAATVSYVTPAYSPPPGTTVTYVAPTYATPAYSPPVTRTVVVYDRPYNNWFDDHVGRFGEDKDR